ncbi:GNAT family N-acetyltransferase [Enterovibrio sp. ZSDZ35]|uniref:GNAT family N-acetyltransferase n=1 Tax=Enterovibrio qingdaonensis TaxID=2899818 RepID=A0ABT5QF06_9GAMM|nr:GNAT family N-acetyltransferase [Enterovibrio sp. ZSDZ35]MDD1779571.1 GNAT family N-acetyltransferase [Enterovibrio sp. ZSDZ35]
MDYLVKLYENAFLDSSSATLPFAIRKPIGPEKAAVMRWITTHFNEHWASEAEVAMLSGNSLFIAVDGTRLLGFACFDGTVKGFFGPLGVDSAARGQGVGEALVKSALIAMRLEGYAYAVIPTSSQQYYQRFLELIEIPGSQFGIYRDMLT